MSAAVSACPPPILQFFNNAGQPNVGGTVLTQVASVNYATYQDAAGNTALPNPIPLNSRGEVSDASGHSQQLFLVQGVTYTFTIYDAAGNQIDQATAVAAQGVTSSSVGGALYPVVAAETTTVVNVQYPYGDIRRYGASTGNADNASYIRNALASGFTVTIPAGIWPIASPIVQTLAGQAILRYGTLLAAQNWASAAQIATAQNNIANQAQTGSLNSFGAVNNFLFSLNGTQASWTGYGGIAFDGGINSGSQLCMADGLQCEGQTTGGQSRVRETGDIRHCPNCLFAITCAYQGDIIAEGITGGQWLHTDSQFSTQSNFTAIGVYVNRADCYVSTGILRWNMTPYRFGPSSHTSTIALVHGYNGNPFGGGAWIDPQTLQVDEGSLACVMTGIYHDGGHADIFSSAFTLDISIPLQSQANSVFSGDSKMARVYATGKGYPFDLVFRTPNKGVNSSNSPSSSLATSMIGFYPSAPINLTTLTSNGTTATATYSTVNPFAPVTNSTIFLDGVTPSSFNNIVTAPACVSNSVYRILSAGTTDFTQIGAEDNTVGRVFVATGGGAGTGTCALGYSVSSGGSVTSGVATITFPCTVNSTGTGGTIQRSFSGNMAGLNAAAGLISAGSYERIESSAGRSQLMLSGTAADSGVWAPTTYFTETKQIGNLPPSVWQHGNQSLQYPYDNFTTGYLALLASNNSFSTGLKTLGTFTGTATTGTYTLVPLTGGTGTGGYGTVTVSGGNVTNVVVTSCGTGYVLADTLSFTVTGGSGTCAVAALIGPYPGVHMAFNQTGTFVGDDGSTHGLMQLATQSNSRLSLDGYSGGVQSLYPNTDNYLNLGYTSGGNHRFATVYAATGSINTSDEREKEILGDMEPALGLPFVLALKPIKYRWKVGGNSITHGRYFRKSTGEILDGYKPGAAHEALLATGKALRAIPQDQAKRSAEQQKAFDELSTKLTSLQSLALDVDREAETVTPVPGKRIHYGLGAKQVRDTLDSLGIGDHAGFVLADPKDPQSQRSLRPDEIAIPELILAVQQLHEKNAAQAALLDALAIEVAALKAKPA